MQLGYIAGNLYVEVVSSWRYMYATSTPLCLIMGVGMCWLPSSPRWLLLCAIQGKGNLPETWPSPLLRSHSTFETVGEFFRRNHPDHYLGQQVHGPLFYLGLIHLAFCQAWILYILLGFEPITSYGCWEMWWLKRQPCFLLSACLQRKSIC